MTTTHIFWLYMGLNDKDTKVQKMDTMDAYDHFQNLASLWFDGATTWISDGVYTHANGKQVTEKTIVCELIFTDAVRVKKFCEELKKTFNQESIAVQMIEAQADLW